MDITTNIDWTERLEKYFCDLGEKSLCFAYLHKKCETRYSKKATHIDLPVIVLSTLAGSLSIGASSLFPENEQTANMGIGVLSLFVGVLNTINSYFSFGRRAENHKLCFIQFGKLHRFIQIEMGLPREQRIIPRDLLKIVREQYERLNEIAPLIDKDIIEGFKKKFNKAPYLEVAKPEICNGLEKIEVYAEQVELGVNTDFSQANIIVERQENNV